MADTKYSWIIDKMVWSYSRIKSFEDCKYRWFLKYVYPQLLINQTFDGIPPTRTDVDMAYIRDKISKEDVSLLYEYLEVGQKEMFFAGYGTFMHRLLEHYLKGEKRQDQLVDEYLQEFRNNVKGQAPNGTVFANYFKSGLQYLKNISPFPYDTIDVEERVDLRIGELPFCGYIDFVGEKDGGIYIVDHKSRTLKPRSKRLKPTKTDLELDTYLRQLYLYSAAIEDRYGVTPRALCFNCFRTNTFIEEPFVEQAYTESKKWFFNSVDKIRSEAEFNPSVDFFKCTYLCEMQNHCEYCELMRKG